MNRPRALWALVLAGLAAGSFAACFEPIDPGGETTTTEEEVDPLLGISEDVEAGSLDDLYRRVIQGSCAGQPGLCHHGQFEPNLSTPALAYANLVERPGLEKTDKLRVVPGDPGASLLVDKLRNRDVISVMPLGAKALSEKDIQAIEQWIAAGAKRFPSAEPLEAINQPPEEPVLGIFDEAGTRLDLGGGAAVTPGERIVLRMTTHDFETPDEAIPYAAFILQTADGGFITLTDDPVDPTTAVATRDTTDPPAFGEESFNWEFTWDVPPTVDVYMFDGTFIDDMPTAGQSFILLGFYIPENVEDYVLALNFKLDAVRVEP